jgi:hypothetical protein
VVKESREREATEDFLANRDYVVLLECMENQALQGRQVGIQSERHQRK